MEAEVEVRVWSPDGEVAPADWAALGGAVGPVAGSLGATVPSLDDAAEAGGYRVSTGEVDEDDAFREICRQVGLVFALSRLRPTWSFSVSDAPPLLTEVAAAPARLWIRDGALVLRHADDPTGGRVVENPALAKAVTAELAYGLGAAALHRLGVATSDDVPSRRAALEATRQARSEASAPPRLLEGPAHGGGDPAPVAIESVAVRLDSPDEWGGWPWEATVRLHVEGDDALDGLVVRVVLRAADGAVIDADSVRLDTLAAGATQTASVQGRARAATTDVVAADAWLELIRTHRAEGVAAVRFEEA